MTIDLYLSNAFSQSYYPAPQVQSSQSNNWKSNQQTQQPVQQTASQQKNFQLNFISFCFSPYNKYYSFNRKYNYQLIVVIINNFIVQLMGVGSAKTVEEEMQINQEEWKYLEFKNRIQVVKHKFFDIYGEINFIPSDPINTPAEELQKFCYRKNQHEGLVQVYGVQYMKSSEANMCGSLKNIRVITEHIPYRLESFPPLNLPEILYVLSESIRGFSVCHQKVGKFDITEKMIGVNSQGFIKVWLNQNFATNHPESQITLLQMTTKEETRSLIQSQQREIIIRIVDLVETKAENNRMPEPIRYKLMNSNNFMQAYTELQDFAEQRNIFIPDRLSIDKILISGERFKTAKQNLVQKGTTKEPHAKYLPNFQYTELNNHNLHSKYVIRNTYVTAPSISHALSYSQQSSQPSNLIITKSKSPQIQFNSILSPKFKTSNAN